MKVGDLVRVRSDWECEDTVGVIIKIEEYYLMAQMTSRAILHMGEEFHLHQLEVISESR